MTTVRRATRDDVPACQAIVRALPDHFSDDVPAKVRADLRAHLGWVATRGDAVLGFAVIERRHRRAAEIRWLAVAPAAQRTGIATRVLDHALCELVDEGVQVVEVKTLDGSAEYPPYEATRAFWERYGFVQIDTIDPLPGWQPGNPAAIYVAALAATSPPRPRETTGGTLRR